MKDALAMIQTYTGSKDRANVKNWPAYLLTLLKKFLGLKANIKIHNTKHVFAFYQLSAYFVVWVGFGVAMTFKLTYHCMMLSNRHVIQCSAEMCVECDF